MRPDASHLDLSCRARLLIAGARCACRTERSTDQGDESNSNGDEHAGTCHGDLDVITVIERGSAYRRPASATGYRLPATGYRLPAEVWNPAFEIRVTGSGLPEPPVAVPTGYRLPATGYRLKLSPTAMPRPRASTSGAMRVLPDG
jgi:hypothetical protein